MNNYYTYEIYINTFSFFYIISVCIYIYIYKNSKKNNLKNNFYIVLLEKNIIAL